MTPDPYRRSSRRWLPVLGATLVLHLVLGVAGHQVLPHFHADEADPVPVSLVILQPQEKDEEEEEEEEDEDVELEEGQIVETAKPKDEERPEDAEYLAEHDTTVEEETKSEKFEVNPEVVAPVHSEEAKLEYEDLVDVNVDKPSTGAVVGNDRFDPSRDGTMAALPSPWTVTNKEGLQDPVQASHKHSTLSGAPQNDLIDEADGDMLQLNTKEVLYASYLLRIRRLVNFYWEQNLDNLPSSVRLAKPRYATEVLVVLTGDGAVETIEITSEAGVAELDDAVVRAYKLAGPFPNPPEQLIDADGRVYLPPMGWTVRFGVAKNQYQGIDPNAGNQFPGILKAPR